MSGEFADFEEYYRKYLQEHRHPWNRRLHLTGWVAGASVTLFALPLAGVFALPLGVGVGLALALAGHRFVEKNRSLVFDHPLWTARADLRMFRAMWKGSR